MSKITYNEESGMVYVVSRKTKLELKISYNDYPMYVPNIYIVNSEDVGKFPGHYFYSEAECEWRICTGISQRDWSEAHLTLRNVLDKALKLYSKKYVDSKDNFFASEFWGKDSFKCQLDYCGNQRGLNQYLGKNIIVKWEKKGIRGLIVNNVDNMTGISIPCDIILSPNENYYGEIFMRSGEKFYKINLADKKLLSIKRPETNDLIEGRNRIGIDETPIVIIGAGSAGGFVALNLYSMGYKNITIIDHDYLSTLNVSRHILDQAYIGMLKAKAVAGLFGFRYKTKSATTFDNEIDYNVVKVISSATHVIDATANTDLLSALLKCDIGYKSLTSLSLFGGSDVVLIKYISGIRRNYNDIQCSLADLNDVLQNKKYMKYGSVVDEQLQYSNSEDIAKIVGLAMKKWKMLISNPVATVALKVNNNGDTTMHRINNHHPKPRKIDARKLEKVKRYAKPSY